MPSSSIARVDPAGATPSLHEVRGTPCSACRGVVASNTSGVTMPLRSIRAITRWVSSVSAWNVALTASARDGIDRRMRHVDPEQAGRQDAGAEDVSGKGSAVLLDHEMRAECGIQRAEPRLVHRARRCDRRVSGRDATHVVRREEDLAARARAGERDAPEGHRAGMRRRMRRGEQRERGHDTRTPDGRRDRRHRSTRRQDHPRRASCR